MFRPVSSAALRPLAGLAAAVLAAGPLAAAEPGEAVRGYVQAQILPWAEEPAVIDALRAANELHAALTEAGIKGLDTAWQAEVGAPARPTIEPVLNNPLSDLLRARAGASQGAITEMFVMDDRGLNVAMTGVTSDFWQGDEAKFTETFGKGAGAIHVGEVELDESTQLFQIQVSFTLTDPATGLPVGAMTVALDAEQF